MSDDEDSLFGSPPPSPQASRPASPALALPRFSSGSSTSTAPLTQNVGTIALPGSQPDSEFPMNPLALSLNHGIVQLPSQSQPVPFMSHTAFTSSTRVSTPRPAPPKKPKKKRREPPPTVKSTGPEFVLPDPSAPPPAHFLRNQKNLLGRAGRVAGVKPATITHTRGASSSNPILIEDDEPDTPIIGRRTRGQSREKSSQPYIDPALLTAPTNQEIVQVLIGQKDIFPILEGVLKLVMKSTPGGTTSRHPPPPPPPPTPAPFVRTGFERRHPAAPPLPTYNYVTKKRKLNRVPAGAADWDVPYPFEHGDGPDSYHQSWERERGKRLISELIKLIKSAARKAATKKYIQEEEARKRERDARQFDFSDIDAYKNEYYGSTSPKRFHTQYQTDTVLQDASNSMATRLTDPLPSTSTSTSGACSPVYPPTTDAAFGHLMASLNGALPDEKQTSVNPLYVSQQAAKPAAVSGVDQPIFDTWMSFLETFPMSFNGTPSVTGDKSSSSQCSTPGISDVNLVATGTPAPAQDYDAMLASLFSQTPSVSDASASAVLSAFDESLIDPALMAMSAASQTPALSSTTPAAGQNDAFSLMGLSGCAPASGGDFAASHSQTPQAPSPNASTSSSLGNNDPSTPVSSAWDLSAPDVYMGGGAMEGGVDVGDGRTGGDYADWNSVMSMGSFPDEATQRVDKGKQRAIDPFASDVGRFTPGSTTTSSNAHANMVPTSASTPPERSITAPLSLGGIPLPPAQSIISTLLQTTGGTPGLSAALSGSTLPFLPKPRGAPPRLLRRDDVVGRARERREKLQLELNAVKTMLWETTIEQAGMVHLVRRLDAAEAAKANALANANTSTIEVQVNEAGADP